MTEPDPHPMPPQPGGKSIPDDCATIDHEQHAGEVIPDPWNDPDQTDWPMNPEGEEINGNVVGTD